MWRLSEWCWSRGFAAEARWCDADAAQPRGEVCVKLMSQQMCTIIPQSEWEMSVGAERPRSWGGLQVRPPSVVQPVLLGS